jgi:hypothetical protein
MKLRLTLLTFVSLLLIGSLVGAATVDTAGVPAAPVPSAPAVASPVQASPLCLANTSKAQLPAVNPAVVQDSASLCGSCSDIWCQGQTLGALCQTGKRCYNLYGFTCSDGVTNKCTCYSGQLP